MAEPREEHLAKMLQEANKRLEGMETERQAIAHAVDDLIEALTLLRRGVA